MKNPKAIKTRQILQAGEDTEFIISSDATKLGGY